MNTAFKYRSRVLRHAQLIIETKGTLRKLAAATGYSKTLIHRDVTVFLKYIDEKQHAQVREILDYNASVKHIRGGEALKRRKQHEKINGSV